VKREYTLPGAAPLNLRAASAADANEYAAVSAIGSQWASDKSACRPTLTARVLACQVIVIVFLSLTLILNTCSENA
jgi:hypothetical protein